MYRRSIIYRCGNEYRQWSQLLSPVLLCLLMFASKAAFAADGRFDRFVPTIRDLRLLDTKEYPYGVLVLGYHRINDGGGGRFWFDGESALPDDGGSVIRGGGGSGRWLREASSSRSVAQFGAVADGLQDNTIAFNNAIRSMGERGGTLAIGTPRGSNAFYRIEGTIELREGIRLVADSSPVSNSGNLAVIEHHPKEAGTSLFEVVENRLGRTGYIGGIDLVNLTVFGASKSGVAFKLTNCMRLSMQGCMVRNFDLGLEIQSAIHSTIRNSVFDKCRISAVRFSGAITTTTSFYDCYLRESPWALILAPRSALNATFVDCIFESCDNGIQINRGNEGTFINCYSENIPRLAKPGSIFEIGREAAGLSSGNDSCAVLVIGGSWMGRNHGTPQGSSFITAGVCHNLVLYGAMIGRVDKVLIADPRTRRIEAGGLTAIEIGGDPYSIADWGCVGGQLPGNRAGGTDKPGLTTSRLHFRTGSTNSWTLVGAYDRTNPDLIGFANAKERWRIDSTGRFGIATVPNSVLHVGGSFAVAITNVFGDYGITGSDHTIIVNSGEATIALPSAVGIAGREYEIVMSAVGRTKITPAGGQRINGAESYILRNRYGYVRLRSDNAQWWVVGETH